MAMVITSNNRTKIIYQGSVKTRQAKQKSIINKAIVCGLIALIALQFIIPIAAKYSL